MKRTELTAVILAFFCAIGSTISSPVNAQESDLKDIVDTAAGDDQFKTVVTAIKAADLGPERTCIANRWEAPRLESPEPGERLLGLCNDGRSG
jgi:hypothetical protein